MLSIGKTDLKIEICLLEGEYINLCSLGAMGALFITHLK
jgi:hypothetical protein